MSKDHFVAQTYVKHFGDPKLRGMLHGYRKPEGTTFPCWPKDVCHEWNGDINPVLRQPELLGNYRKYFEPHWNASTANIVSGKIVAHDKWAISGYMANLMACIPAWHRVDVRAGGKMAEAMVRNSVELRKKHGEVISEPLEWGLACLKNGQMKVAVDPDGIKASATNDLIQYAWLSYNLDWVIIKNETEQPFITSDNPFAYEWSGEFNAPVRRYLPITPQYCICIVFDPDCRDDRVLTPQLLEEGLTRGPAGGVRGANARPVEVREINKLMVQCAEEQVFSSESIENLPSVIQKYGQYRLEAEFFEVSMPGQSGVKLGHRIVVRPRID